MNADVNIVHKMTLVWADIRTCACNSSVLDGKTYSACTIAKSRPAGYMFCFCFLFLTIPLRQIISKSIADRPPHFRGWSAVDDKIWISSHGNRILLVFVHGCGWTEAASGAAGRANVGHLVECSFDFPELIVVWFSAHYAHRGGSVAEWLACWTQAQKGPGSNCSRDAVG